MYHILFEQSGTFRDVLKDLGHDAICYDIENQFNKTDVIIDLFSEIDIAYGNELTNNIFDNIKPTDTVIAFYPCTYFSKQNNLIFNGTFKAFKNWDKEKISRYQTERLKVRDSYFVRFLKLIKIAERIGFKLIIENPGGDNYLIKNYKTPDLIITNRKSYGDTRVKPTIFYITNGKFKNNQLTTPGVKDETVISNNVNGITRSLIHKDFARYFIRNFIL